MKATRIILETMRELGGEALFNLPGRGIYPLLNELAAIPELRYVSGLHEFAVASAADGYARASGKPAFVNLYMSTGVMNAASALFMAHRDRIPLIVTASQTESWGVGAHSRAECDSVLDVIRPVTKWAWEPPTAARVQEALVRAHSIAVAPPQGPTFVTLPLDFTEAELDMRPVAALAPRTGGVLLADDFTEAGRWLTTAERPLLVIGGEAVLAGAAEPAAALARALGAPIAAEPDPPFQPVATDDPLHAGEIGWIPELVSDADVILYVGVNTIEPFDRELLRSGRTKRHLWVGTDAMRLNENLQPDWVWLGNLEAGVGALRQAVGDRAPSCHAEPLLRSWRERLALDLGQASREPPMSVAAAFAALRDAVPEEALIVEQCTTVSPHFRRHFRVPSPRHYIASSGSNQGWAVGAAVGAKIARPDLPVIAVIGDGTLMFGVQALFTAVRYAAPVIFVVINNGGWSSMRMGMDRAAPDLRRRNIDLGFGWEIGFVEMARSFGADGRLVETPQQLASAVAEALRLGTTFMIDARCKREILHRLN